MSLAIATSTLLAVTISGAALLTNSRESRHVASPRAPRAVTAMPQAVNKYVEVCQACHQATGQGMPGAFPPLVGSEWLNGRADIPIAIVLKGLQGEITVKGTKYNGAMMAWEAVLNDADLAATLTYARSQWGNRGTPVTAAQVKAIRTRFAGRTAPWTEAELKAFK
jgi:mono/diheme cytochrome c family protein